MKFLRKSPTRVNIFQDKNMENTKSLTEYEDKNLRLALIGDDLLKCSEISRAEGLLAMQKAAPQLKGGSRFLTFAISYIINLFTERTEFEASFALLENHVNNLPAEEQTEGRMVAAALKKIFAGESPESIQETVSYYQTLY